MGLINVEFFQGKERKMINSHILVIEQYVISQSSWFAFWQEGSPGRALISHPDAGFPEGALRSTEGGLLLGSGWRPLFTSSTTVQWALWEGNHGPSLSPSSIILYTMEQQQTRKPDSHCCYLEAWGFEILFKNSISCICSSWECIFLT